MDIYFKSKEDLDKFCEIADSFFSRDHDAGYVESIIRPEKKGGKRVTVINHTDIDNDGNHGRTRQVKEAEFHCKLIK